MKKKAQPIENILKRFKKKDEWLLIGVEDFDRSRTLPLTGRLLEHTPDRFEIERMAGKYKGKTLIIHSHPRIQRGYAAAF